MNTLAFLLLTTCTPGADPMAVIDSRSSAIPSYSNYGPSEVSGTPQESRPRFFPRLRNLFSRKSQGTDSRITESSAGYPYNMTANGTMGSTIITPSPMTVPSTSGNSINSSILRPQPAFAPSNGAGLQRMPTGQPSPSSQPF